jgi:hypothetical protein
MGRNSVPPGPNGINRHKVTESQTRRVVPRWAVVLSNFALEQIPTCAGASPDLRWSIVARDKAARIPTLYVAGLRD